MLEVYPTDYGLVLFGQSRADGELGAHLALLSHHQNLVRSFELPIGVEPTLGAKMVGSDFVFGTRVGGKIVYRAISLFTGDTRVLWQTGEGILSDVQPLTQTEAKIIQIRNEPFDGPLTTQHFGGGVYSNGFERALDGMLYIVVD